MTPEQLWSAGVQPVFCTPNHEGTHTPLTGTTGGVSWPVHVAPPAAYRLAFRPPPHGLVMDVDDHDGQGTGPTTIGKLEAELGALPPTWRLSARGPGNPAGRRLYRIPPELVVTDALFKAYGGSVDAVRTGHRFSWAPGDVNPRTGTPVVCYGPDNQPAPFPHVDSWPELPAAWVAKLLEHQGQAAAIVAKTAPTADPVAQFMTGELGRPPQSLEAAQRAVDAKLAEVASHSGSGFRTALLRAAVTLGGYVGGAPWFLSADRARELLLDAVTHVWGGPDADDHRWVEQGLADGARAPFSVYDPSRAQVDRPRSSWAAVDLAKVRDGEQDRIEPTLMPREDGRCLMYAGKVHWFHGESESGKSLILQAECARLLQLGEPVLYVDFEDDAHGITQRMLMFGATWDQIGRHLVYVRPDEPLGGASGPDWGAVLQDRRYTLAVVDGVTDAVSMQGWSSNADTEVSKWIKWVPKAIAQATGAGVAVIDHVAKNPQERGRFALGSQFKLAGVDGAAYYVEPTQALRRGYEGYVQVSVVKDRPGGVRPHCSLIMDKDRKQVAASVWINSSVTPDRPEVRWFAPPAVVTSAAASPREALRATICDWLESMPEPQNTRALRTAVSGDNSQIDKALAELQQSGHIVVEKSGREHLHRLLKPYERADVLERAGTVLQHTDANRAGVLRPIGSSTQRVPDTAQPTEEVGSTVETEQQRLLREILNRSQPIEATP